MVGFKEFLKFFEAIQWGFVGPMNVILGSGKAGTVNYGGSANFPTPFLYVPVEPKIIKSYRRKAEKRTFDCIQLGNRWECSDTPAESVKDSAKDNLMWTGEAHLTIAYGPDLQKAAGGKPVEEYLKNTYLFNEDGSGKEIEINPVMESPDKPVFKLFPATSFEKSPGGGNAMALVVPVEVPEWDYIRNKLHLPGTAPTYQPHITVGYVFLRDLEQSGWKWRTTRRIGKGVMPATVIHNLTKIASPRKIG